MCMMISGTYPYPGSTLGELHKHIKAHPDPQFVGADWEKVTDDAKDLIRRMLKVNPRRRITASMALKHPWFLKQSATNTSTPRSPNDLISFENSIQIEEKSRNLERINTTKNNSTTYKGTQVLMTESVDPAVLTRFSQFDKRASTLKRLSLNILV